MPNYKEFLFSILKFFKSPDISEDLSFSESINNYLKEKLNEYNSYLEYGSGSSTIYFSRNKKFKIVSVESDKVFANSVLKIINNNNVKIFIAKVGLTGYWGYPIFFKNSYSKGFNYVNTPWKNLGNEYMPDVVLIDGRYRVACALNILLKAANNCKILIIIDDYNGRDEYKIFEQFCNKINSIERMAFFEYDGKLIDSQEIEKIKKYLNLYLTKPE